MEIFFTFDKKNTMEYFLPVISGIIALISIYSKKRNLFNKGNLIQILGLLSISIIQIIFLLEFDPWIWKFYESISSFILGVIGVILDAFILVYTFITYLEVRKYLKTKSTPTNKIVSILIASITIYLFPFALMANLHNSIHGDIINNTEIIRDVAVLSIIQLLFILLRFRKQPVYGILGFFVYTIVSMALLYMALQYIVSILLLITIIFIFRLGGKSLGMMFPHVDISGLSSISGIFSDNGRCIHYREGSCHSPSFKNNICPYSGGRDNGLCRNR